MPRTRTYVISGITLASFVLLCILVLNIDEETKKFLREDKITDGVANEISELKDSTGEEEQEQPASEEQEQADTEAGRRETPTAPEETEEAAWAGEKLPEVLESFNPLDAGYKRVGDWGDYGADGIVSGAAADFRNVGDCRRVVVFLADEVVLGHVVTDCDAMEPAMGLVMVDDIMYYYGTALAMEGASQDEFVIYEKFPGEQKCSMKLYTVDTQSRESTAKNRQNVVVEASEDYDCGLLVNFSMPPMLLLATHGDPGLYAPGKYWATINPWDPLGMVTKIYWYGPRCFRLLVITSFGRSVQAVKVSCGPIQNVVITEDAFYYNDAIVVRRNPQSDVFEIIFNPKRSGDCIKKIVSITDTQKHPEATVRSTEDLSYEDEECQSLVRGDVQEATVNNNVVDGFVEKLEQDNVGVEPYEVSMSSYRPWGPFSYFNLSVDIGIAVRFYKKQRSIQKLVLLTGKGVPLIAALLPFSPVQRLVMREDAVYYNTTVMAKKTEENTFVTLVQIGEEDCLKQAFQLTEKNGMLVREELPTEGEVTASMDEDCMELLDGRSLRSDEYPEAENNTDEDGVPNYIPAQRNT